MNKLKPVTRDLRSPKNQRLFTVIVPKTHCCQTPGRPTVLPQDQHLKKKKSHYCQLQPAAAGQKTLPNSIGWCRVLGVPVKSTDLEIDNVIENNLIMTETTCEMLL